MAKKGSEIVDFEARILHETDAAYYFAIGGVRVWLAKSLVEWDGETVTMPRWVAEDKELV